MKTVQKAWKDVQSGDYSLEQKMVVLVVEVKPGDRFARVWYEDGTLAKPFANSITLVIEDYIAP